MSLLTNELEKASSIHPPAATAQSGHPFSVRRSLFIWIMLLAIFWTLIAVGAYAILSIFQ